MLPWLGVGKLLLPLLDGVGKRLLPLLGVGKLLLAPPLLRTFPLLRGMASSLLLIGRNLLVLEDDAVPSGAVDGFTDGAGSTGEGRGAGTVSAGVLTGSTGAAAVLGAAGASGTGGSASRSVGFASSALPASSLVLSVGGVSVASSVATVLEVLSVVLGGVAGIVPVISPLIVVLGAGSSLGTRCSRVNAL